MSDLNDLKEFMEASAASKPPSNPATSPSSEGVVLTSGSSPQAREKDAPGMLVQWAQNGGGYVPTTRTHPVLASGVYRIGYVNDRATWLPMNVVTDDFVRLPDSKSDAVITEIERFWTMKAKFSHYGLSHKRGFLLWGPPGSGKTSTITDIMRQTVARGDVVLVADAHPGTVTTCLAQFREVEPQRRVVVIFEDIDTLIQRHGESDVLSILDGETSISNVVFIATTNYPENLDGRIVNRPSRFDQVVKIGTPNPDARRIYIQSRKTDLTSEEIERWVTDTDGFSIAHIKELVISVLVLEKPYEQEIERLYAMNNKKLTSDGDRAKVGFGS